MKLYCPSASGVPVKKLVHKLTDVCCGLRSCKPPENVSGQIEKRDPN